MLGVARVDPHRVVVAVDADVVGGPRRHLPERPAPVLALVELDPEDVDAVGVGGVDEDVAVVHRAGVEPVHLLPRPAPVGRPVGAALFGMLDRGVEDVRVALGDGEPDPALVALGNPIRQLLPRLAPVRRLKDAAARPAAVEPPRLAQALVGRRVEDVRVVQVHHQVHHARERVGVEHLLPGLAAVGRLVNAALRARLPEVAQRRHVGDVGVFRMNANAPDVPRLFQTKMSPRLARVGAAVDAVPPRGALAVVLLARPGPEDVRVRGGDGEVAEGAHRLPLEDRLPRRPLVRRLPQPA